MLFFILFVIAVIIGLPIAFGMGIAGIVFLPLNDVPIKVIVQKMFAGADSFTMLAVPLYILAGELMESGGISRRIIDLAYALVAHIRGGLGHVVVVATLFLSGISGSSTADTAAIASVMVPNMVRKGYLRAKAVAIVAAAGGMDILIPPCLTMIILGSVVNISIGFLFFAGILPAIVMSLALMIVIYKQAKAANIPMEPRKSLPDIWAAFKDAALPLVLPIIILGGIKIGAFTATEGAVAAVLYSMLVAGFIYHEIHWSDLPDIFLRSAKTTGVIMMLAGMATLFAWVTAREQIPELLLNSIVGLSSSPIFFLVVVNVLFLFIGAVLEGSPAVIILAPLFYPVAYKLGIDPIHFGTVIMANLGVGFLLPPIGLCLMVASAIGKIPIEEVSKEVSPYFVAMVIALIVITYFPQVSLFLPKMAGYMPTGTFL